MRAIQHVIEPQCPCRTSSPHWAGPQRSLVANETNVIIRAKQTLFCLILFIIR